MRTCSIALATHDEDRFSLLGSTERGEYESLVGNERRRDWLAGRIAAKRALGSLASQLPRHVQLVPRPGRAPVGVLNHGALSTRLPFSVSIGHRDGWGIAAASRLSVGVDIDRTDAVSGEHARYFVSKLESRAAGLFGLSTLWILKEAAWKALGLGHDVSFRDLAISLAPDGRVTGAVIGSDVIRVWATTWSLPGGLTAAVFAVRPVSA